MPAKPMESMGKYGLKQGYLTKTRKGLKTTQKANFRQNNLRVACKKKYEKCLGNAVINVSIGYALDSEEDRWAS